MTIQGVSHITFIVRDLERATAFFLSVFDAKEVYDSAEKTFSVSQEKFFLVGEQWIAVMQGDTIVDRSYDHVAFKIRDEDFREYEARVKRLGLDILPDRPRVPGEGRSLYFYDFDNHLFELHTATLTERLRAYSSQHA